MPNSLLHDTAVKLNIYAGTPSQVFGIMQATVLYNQQSATPSLVVIAGTGASLMGSSWLERLY